MKDIKDYLHLYLGCEVESPFVGKHQTLAGISATVMPEGHKEICPQIKFAINGYWDLRPCSYSSVKPILRPLSDMTEEDCCAIAKILISPHAVYHISKPAWCIESARYWAKHGLIAVFSSNAFQTLKAFNYLRSKGYDCDGLIESGLALDKTKLK